MAWQTEAKKLAAGKWIKFDSENLIHVVTFEGEPTKKEKTSTIKGKEGEIYFQMSFPVTEDGEDRFLEPNNSLLRQIIAEDEVESIMGRTIMIKLLDPQKKQNWMLRPVGNNQTLTRTPGKAEPNTQEPAAPPGLTQEEMKKQNDDARAKFAAEVAKKTKVRKMLEEDAVKGVAEIERKREANTVPENTEGITEEKEPDVKPRKRSSKKRTSEQVEEAN